MRLQRRDDGPGLVFWLGARVVARHDIQGKKGGGERLLLYSYGGGSAVALPRASHRAYWPCWARDYIRYKYICQPIQQITPVGASPIRRVPFCPHRARRRIPRPPTKPSLGQSLCGASYFVRGQYFDAPWGHYFHGMGRGEVGRRHVLRTWPMSVPATTYFCSYISTSIDVQRRP